MINSEFLVSSATILSGGSPAEVVEAGELSIGSIAIASGSLLFKARERLCESAPGPLPRVRLACKAGSWSEIAPAGPGGLAELPLRPTAIERGETLRVGRTTFISLENIDCRTVASSATGRF